MLWYLWFVIIGIHVRDKHLLLRVSFPTCYSSPRAPWDPDAFASSATPFRENINSQTLNVSVEKKKRKICFKFLGEMS